MELEQLLNEFLADLNVFYRKLQNYHWNIEGKDFFVIHSKLEEYYDEINAQIDEIAEHILILGHQPMGTMKGYLETSKIQEAEDKKVSTDVVLRGTIEGINTLKQNTFTKCVVLYFILGGILMDETKEVLNGNIKISDEVIETIASVAVSEIEGVCSTGTGFVDGIARRLSKKPVSSGIKATSGEDSTSVDINIVVKYGVRIPEVAWNVQDAVKREIELMTGLKVDKVNVRIVGIDIPAEENENTENTTDEE